MPFRPPVRESRLRECCAAVEDADVVQSEESTFKDIVSKSVLAIHPPREVQQQFLEDPSQKGSITLPGCHLLVYIDSPSCHSLHRRIHVAKVPLIGRDLTITMACE
jgi:hypothetical protein